MKQEKIAVIRVRGSVNLNHQVKHTLELLRLYRKNYCVVLDNTPITKGMINKVKDHVTWGAVSAETLKTLLEKRSEPYKGRETDSRGRIKYKKFNTFNNKKIKPYFRLNPPKKGFGRKGIKQPFSVGGALGNRKEKINDLIARMI